MNIEEIKKKEEWNQWFKTELFIFWISLSLMILIVYPYLTEQKSGGFGLGMIIMILVYLLVLFLVAAVFALTQTRGITIKNKNHSFKKNFNKVIALVVVITIVSFILLTRWQDSNVILEHDTIFLGRIFVNHGVHYGGLYKFYTILSGLLCYAVLSYANLKRLEKKQSLD